MSSYFATTETRTLGIAFITIVLVVLIAVVIWLAVAYSGTVPARPESGPTGTVEDIPPKSAYYLFVNSGVSANNFYLQAFNGNVLGVSVGNTAQYFPGGATVQAYQHFHATQGDTITSCPNSLYVGTTAGGTCLYVDPATNNVRCIQCTSAVGITAANWVFSSDGIGQSQGSVRLKNCLGGGYLSSDVDSVTKEPKVLVYTSTPTGRQTQIDFFAWS